MTCPRCEQADLVSEEGIRDPKTDREEPEKVKLLVCPACGFVEEDFAEPEDDDDRLPLD